MAWSRKRIAWVAAGAAAMLVATLVVLNLIPAAKRIEHHVDRFYDTGSPDYYRALGVLLGPPVIGGNRVEALQNGEEIFPSMLAAIRGARRTITFESYIYWSGEIGEAFATALADALVERFPLARARVRVRKPDVALARPVDHAAVVVERRAV
jgi:cardiolipin synthase